MNKLIMVVSLMVIVSHLVLGHFVAQEYDQYQQVRSRFQTVTAHYKKVVGDLSLVASYARRGQKQGMGPVRPIESELKEQLTVIKAAADAYLTGARKAGYDVAGKDTPLVKVSLPGGYAGIVEVPYIVECSSWEPRVYGALEGLLKVLSRVPRRITGVYITGSKVIVEGGVVGTGVAGGGRRRGHRWRR